MNQELVDYIKQQLSLNVSKNKITDVLLGQGWQQTELDEAFAAAEGAKKAEENKIVYEENATAPTDELEGEGEGMPAESSKKKMLWIVIITVVLAVAVIIILVMASGSSKKEETTLNPPVTPTTENGAAVNPNGATSAEENKENVATTNEGGKPVVDNTALINAAEILLKTITPPTDWQPRQGIVNEKPLVGYFKPVVEGTKEHPVTENVTVTAQALQDAKVDSEEAYIEKAKTELENTMPDYKLITKKKVKLSDGSEATLIGSSSTRDGNAIRSMQLFAFKNGVAYIVTGMTLASNWEAEKDMLGAAVLSFKFPE